VALEHVKWNNYNLNCCVLLVGTNNFGSSNGRNQREALGVSDILDDWLKVTAQLKYVTAIFPRSAKPTQNLRV